jgi:site-specific DNA-methyltransferase (adenine-specific)
MTDNGFRRAQQMYDAQEQPLDDEPADCAAKVGEIICGDCFEEMKKIPDNFIDLTVTSPPYDNLRDYTSFTFDFEGVARELYRVTKLGGVVVWVIGDATISGSETGTSFKQALYFKQIGFNLHDTMIWSKPTFTAVGALVNRYAPVFDYMFVLSKGFPKTFNPIKDRPNKHAGTFAHGTIRQEDGSTKRITTHNKKTIPFYGQRFNIWEISNAGKRGNKHPASFPEELAEDHILSWSNERDIVLDPFAGSGTTLKMAKKNNRHYIGIEISEEYCEMIRERLLEAMEGGLR